MDLRDQTVASVLTSQKASRFTWVFCFQTNPVFLSKNTLLNPLIIHQHNETKDTICNRLIVKAGLSCYVLTTPTLSWEHQFTLYAQRRIDNEICYSLQR